MVLIPFSCSTNSRFQRAQLPTTHHQRLSNTNRMNLAYAAAPATTPTDIHAARTPTGSQAALN